MMGPACSRRFPELWSILLILRNYLTASNRKKGNGPARGHGVSKIAHIRDESRRDLQVGNNSMKAPLNTSARGGRSSVSVENSDGIDPDYCCRVAVVGGGGYWGRRRGHW